MGATNYNKEKIMEKMYYIEHLREGTTYLDDQIITEINGTYQDAVNAAHEIWRSLDPKHLVTVHSNHYCIHWLHWIDTDGTAKDRNSNSGVVSRQEDDTRIQASTC
jgi:hypothetical protein